MTMKQLFGISLAAVVLTLVIMSLGRAQSVPTDLSGQPLPMVYQGGDEGELAWIILPEDHDLVAGQMQEYCGDLPLTDDCWAPYMHWLASAYTIKQLWDHLMAQSRMLDIWAQIVDDCMNPPEPTPEPTPDVPYICYETHDMKDGPGGSLWKPVSEGGGIRETEMEARFQGHPVILMPGEYGYLGDIPIFSTSEEWEGKAYRVSNYHDRPAWRLTRHCSDLPDDLVLVFDEECRTVPDPCERWD